MEEAFGRAAAALETAFRTRGVAVPVAPPCIGTRQPSALPVAAFLAQALADAPASLRPLCDALAAVGDALSWRQNASYAGAAFLHGYGYCELAGPEGHLRDSGKSMGLLLLAPHVAYPAHWHPAVETYLILSGAARWQIGAADPQWRHAGELIRHPSRVSHAMCAGAAPLLAAYLWEDHLDQPARLSHPEDAAP
jgi:mannose-6-phosphate isomerase-like protein (cupin superfamily)